MLQDSSPPNSPWSAPPHGASDGSAAAAAPPSQLRPPRGPESWVDPVAADTSGGRVHRLLWIFSLLTVVLVAPSVIARIEYSRTAAIERAKYDVAREEMQALNLTQVSAGYRMIPQLVSPSVVNVRTKHGPAEGQGSGVIVDKTGYIVTNNHVMEGVTSAEIQLSDGRRGLATVIGVDPLTDIAVLKTEMTDLIPAEWGDSDDLEVGDLVWAMGSPFGLQKSVTSGILSAKERRGMSGHVIQEFLQTDAAVNPGNSGGPLVDIHGKIIGINTAIIGPSYQGISFAIPAALARSSYEQLREHGYVLRGYLGVGPAEVPDEVARDLDLERGTGVWVYSVGAATPASEAGVREGDVILSWNGKEFSDPTLLSQAIAATPIGSDATMVVLRRSLGGAKRMDLKVKVAARPKDL
jgi:S1-C subfamily serine protease